MSQAAGSSGGPPPPAAPASNPHTVESHNSDRNPFRIPTIEDIFVLRAAAAQQGHSKHSQKQVGGRQPLHLKQTFNSAFTASGGRGVALEDVQLTEADRKRIHRNEAKTAKLLEFRQKSEFCACLGAIYICLCVCVCLSL